MSMSPYAKQALRAKHAYVAALLASAAALAGAQPAPGAGPAADGPGPGMMQHGMQGPMGHGRMDPEKMQAMAAKHHAELKAKLKLSAEQETAWASFTEAMKPGKRPLAERPQPADLEKLSTPERIDKLRALREQRHTAMAAEMAKREDATKAFYNQLSAEQKKVFDAETFRMHAHGRAAQAHQGHGQH